MTAEPRLPRVPGWVRALMARLLPPEDHRVVMQELAELHAAWARRFGVREADRRYLRQIRRYPFLLLAHKVRTGAAVPLPGGREIPQAGRSLLRAPALTATIILTVGVGIGGCATIFAMVDALYLQPLPYRDAGKLTWIYTDAPPNRFNFSVVDFEALQAQQTSFEAVVGTRRAARTLTTDEGAERVSVLEATPGFVALTDVGLPRGRAPTPDEGAADAHATVLVTAGFAARYMGVTGDDAAGAIGRTVTLDGEPFQAIGILPPDLGPLARHVDAIPTLRLQPPRRKGPFFLKVFGRLRPGVTPQTAVAELRALNARLFPLWQDSYQDRNATWGLDSVAHFVRGPNTGRLLGVLMAAVAMVLLIAVANAANLMLARVDARGRELAVRAALGASSGRLRGHLLAESGLLAVGGMAIGLLAARAGTAILPVVASSYLVRVDEARLGGHTLAFAMALTAGSGLILTLVPALARRRDRDLATELRATGKGSAPGVSRQRSQRLLVAGQLAVVMPLLAGAFLLVSSFARLEAADPGFDASHLITMRVSLSGSRYASDSDRRQFWDPGLERLGALPGVEGVALSTERPPDDVGDINNFDLEDRPTAESQSDRVAPWIVVDRSFFDVMRVPLLEGRTFEASDLDDDAPPVAVVDQAWARQNYPGEDALGRRFYSGGQSSGPRTTVVGVVGSVPYMGIGTSRLGAVYVPVANTLSSPYLLVRASGDLARVTARLRETLHALDPTSPVTELATGDELLSESLTRPRHLSLLLSIFSAVALALAVIGIYGITSYSVQQRRSDIAVRLALGGRRGAVVGMVLGDGMRVAVPGLALGCAAALALTGALSSLLYQVSPRDPWALAVAATLLLTVSASACLIPGVRAVRVNPATILREE
jgi:putative ABC transport system permease protein